jgi:hypothetical protein
LTGFDQTALSFQDLYAPDDEPSSPHTNNFKRQSSDPSTSSSSVAAKNSSNHHLYSPTSSIYPSLSPTEGDIRGNAPPFTLGTPGGGYQGIQAGYQLQRDSQGGSTQSSPEGIYSSSSGAEAYGVNIPQQTQAGPYIPLDMTGGVAMGLGGGVGHMDPQQMQAMNGYYMTAANTQQGMFPEYYMGTPDPLSS